MPDPGEEKKISELDTAATLEDTDEIVIARPGAPYANYSVTGAIVKASAKPAGSDKQVQFNDGGVLSAISTFIFTKATGLLQTTIFKATSYFQGCMAGYKVIAAGDTTPSVAGTHVLVYNTAADLTITGLDDGIAGQVVTIVVHGGNTLTVNPFFYASAGAAVLNGMDTLKLLYTDGVWQEISRSHNC